MQWLTRLTSYLPKHKGIVVTVKSKDIKTTFKNIGHSEKGKIDLRFLEQVHVIPTSSEHVTSSEIITEDCGLRANDCHISFLPNDRLHVHGKAKETAATCGEG